MDEDRIQQRKQVREVMGLALQQIDDALWKLSESEQREYALHLLHDFAMERMSIKPAILPPRLEPMGEHEAMEFEKEQIKGKRIVKDLSIGSLEKLADEEGKNLRRIQRYLESGRARASRLLEGAG